MGGPGGVGVVPLLEKLVGIFVNITRKVHCCRLIIMLTFACVGFGRGDCLCYI